MTIYIAADHRGFDTKQQLVSWLQSSNYTVTDLGARSLDPTDDYVDYAIPVAQQVLNSPDNRGVLLCGSGVGMSIAANKLLGIRAAVGLNPDHVGAARRDDDLNILCLATDYYSLDQIQAMIIAFLQTNFNSTEPRYQRRLDKLRQIRI